jgi:broad specificity phosphatase PhoE
MPNDLRLPSADSGLTADGWREADAVADRLRRVGPAVVYTSDALRARQTGAVIAERCGVTLHALASLREIDFGAWGGRTFAELVAGEPWAAAYFANPASVFPPGVEPIAAAAGRVLDALRSLASVERGEVVVVGHAGSLRLALARGLGMPLAAYWRLRLDFAGLSVLDWAGDGSFIVERLNDVAHLPAGSAGRRRVITSAPQPDVRTTVAEAEPGP